jgi:hypothetical protein
MTRSLREDVVHDVVLDDAVENVAANEAELAVHRRHGALLVRPAALLVVRRFFVRVVQVGNRDCTTSILPL